jgi:hypothetical protein
MVVGGAVGTDVAEGIDIDGGMDKGVEGDGG